jgi:hypothetical protein
MYQISTILYFCRYICTLCTKIGTFIKLVPVVPSFRRVPKDIDRRLHGDKPARGTVLVTELVYGTVRAFAVVQA